jgi:type II secretory pathway pseudopilin PulG
MKNNQNSKYIKKAFSILELSVVLLIIGALISSSIGVYKTVISSRKNMETKDKFEIIYQALGSYFKKYHRLPCPAAITLLKSNASFGKEVTCNYDLSTNGSSVGIWQDADNNNLVYGAVPIAELGLSKEIAIDGFGAKIAYVVIKGFTDQSTSNSISSSTLAVSGQNFQWDSGDGSSTNRIRIHQRNGANISKVTSEGIITLISYGYNRNCSYLENSSARNALSSDSDELRNCIANMDSTTGEANFFDYVFASNKFPFIANSDNDIFDDLIFFKGKKDFMLDFNYYKNPPCSDDFSQILNIGGDDYVFHWSGNNSLDEEDISVSTISCPENYDSDPHAGPTKKCGYLKRWRDEIEVNCEL